MTSPKCDLSLIIPCYRDAPHLRRSVGEVRRVLSGSRWSWEIIFVNDASPDECRDIIRDIIASHPEERLMFVDHEANTGRGRTVTDGFHAATGRIAGFLDIDLEVPAHYLTAMVQAIENGADVACAQRIYKLRPAILHRAALSTAYIKLVNRFLGASMPDTEAGYKFFNRERLLPVLDQVDAAGWFWDTEIMVRSALAGLRIVFVPVLFIRNPDKASTVRLVADSIEHLRMLWRFRSVVQRLRTGPSEWLPLIYRSPLLYHLVMRTLHGARFDDRYRAIAAEIPHGASVVELCAGDAWLFRHHLARKNVRYLGLDNAPAFLRAANRLGIPVRAFDARLDKIPSADVIVMQASLYQFPETFNGLVGRMLDAARVKAVIAEPVHNLASSSNPALAWVGRRLTRPHGCADSVFRFTASTFEAALRRFPEFERVFPEAGGREMVAILRGRNTAAANDDDLP